MHVGHYNGSEGKYSQCIHCAEDELADSVEQGLVPPEDLVPVKALLHQLDLAGDLWLVR